MVQRFVVELGGSQVGQIEEDEVAEALMRLIHQHEHGMGSIHLDVEEIPASARLQIMPGYLPVSDFDSDPDPDRRWMP